MGVPAGSCEIEPGRPEAGADRRVGRQLPTRAQLQSAVGRVQYEWPRQPPRGGGELHQRRQRQHRCLELGVAGSGEDLLHESREALERKSSATDQVMEPRNGRGADLFVNFVQGR